MKVSANGSQFIQSFAEVLQIRGTSGYAINLENFSKRLKMLYSHWNEHNNDMWGASEAFAVATLPPSEDLRYLKSSALNVWLLGYEFPDTIMVFMKKQTYFFCSQKKAFLLEIVKKICHGSCGCRCYDARIGEK